MITLGQLVGSWTLDRFVITCADGRPPLLPFGEDGEGLLVYGADGWMSAILARADRAPLGTDRLENAQRAGIEAKAEAFDTYLSYGGRWHVDPDGEHVLHEVVYALTPELVGKTNRRRVARVDVEHLDLTYDLTPPSGNTRTYELKWRRAR